MILVTVEWRGALNIGQMRTFSNATKARAYYKKLARAFGIRGMHWARGYETYDAKEPKLVWSYAKDKKKPMKKTKKKCDKDCWYMFCSSDCKYAANHRGACKCKEHPSPRYMDEVHEEKKPVQKTVACEYMCDATRCFYSCSYPDGHDGDHYCEGCLPIFTPKTDVVLKQAKKRGLKVQEIVLSECDPEDLGGLPVRNPTQMDEYLHRQIISLKDTVDLLERRLDSHVNNRSDDWMDEDEKPMSAAEATPKAEGEAFSRASTRVGETTSFIVSGWDTGPREYGAIMLDAMKEYSVGTEFKAVLCTPNDLVELTLEVTKVGAEPEVCTACRTHCKEE